MPAGYSKNENVWMETNGANGGTKEHFYWINEDEMAFVCDQFDDCPGFRKRRDGKAPDLSRVGGGWMGNGTFRSWTSDGAMISYLRDTRGPIASVHKPNEPSVLENPQTKVQFFDGGNFDGEMWEYGRGMQNGPFGGENRVASIKIPLGYKFIGFEHYLGWDAFGQWRNGAGNTTGVKIGPVVINGGDMGGWGMVDRISSFIIEQIPFDVNAHWDDMTNSQNRITSGDAQQIKEAYCSTPAGIQSDRCVNAGLSKRCQASSLPCYSAASDLQCPTGYDTKDIPNNKCYGYTIPNVAQVNCPTGFTRAAGNSALCTPITSCEIARGYQGGGGAC